MRLLNGVCSHQEDLRPVISIILIVDLGRGLFQAGVSRLLHTPTVMDDLNLVTDLTGTYG